MDKETVAAMGFMLFGLGFFVFIMLVVLRTHTSDHERRIMEIREFGFRDTPKSYLRRFQPRQNHH